MSFIAGIVNITGVLSISTLTTNVTGHFAYFAEELVSLRYSNALFFLMFILFFLLGAFASSFLVELVSRIRPSISHAVPMAIEVLILCAIALLGHGFVQTIAGHYMVACALLFSMGIQNSLVTHISQATVRTTHLTGLFTDLGIELSQLFFYRQPSQIRKLSKSINLRLVIIIFFFTGCILGGFLFNMLELKTLFLAAGLLITALFYDTLRYRFYFYQRKVSRR